MVFSGTVAWRCYSFYARCCRHLKDFSFTLCLTLFQRFRLLLRELRLGNLDLVLKFGFRIATVAKACLLLNRYFLIIFRRYADARKSVRKLRRTLRADPNALILAFDLEVYEHDHSIILEIGYAMTTLNNPKKMQKFHYIIKENLRYVSSWNC